MSQPNPRRDPDSALEKGLPSSDGLADEAVAAADTSFAHQLKGVVVSRRRQRERGTKYQPRQRVHPRRRDQLSRHVLAGRRCCGVEIQQNVLSLADPGQDHRRRRSGGPSRGE